MRNLKECRAEVFRRSEERIKTRKRRSACAFAVCIPLVLSAALFSVTLLPGSSMESAAPDGVTGGVSIDGSESLICSVAEIRVIGPDVSLVYGKASDVLRIYDRLHSYGTSAPENFRAPESAAEDDAEPKQNADGFVGSILDTATGGYTITLVMHEGENTEFYLSGNTLENVTEKKTQTLSPQQVEELKDMLGIPQ